MRRARWTAGRPTSSGWRYLAVGLALLWSSAGAATADAAGLANSAWPMFQHDPQHTGRSPNAAPANLAPKWRFRVEGIPGSPAVGSDGAIYLPTGNPSQDTSGSLYAVNPNGTLRWRYRFPSDPDSGCDIVAGFTTPAIADDGTVYVHTQSAQPCIAGPSRLLAFNPNGTPKWVYPINGGGAVFISDNISAPSVGADGTIYLGSADTGLYAINPDGTTQWVVSPEATSISSSPAIGADGTIYVTVAGLFAYNPNGSLKWGVPLSNVVPVDHSPSVGVDGTIYACGEGPDACHAFGPAGNEIWSFPFAAGASTTPAIAGDGTIYFAGGKSLGVVAHNPSGSRRWKAGLDNSLPRSPTVSANGKLYVRSEDGGFLGRLSALYVLNANGSRSAKALARGQSKSELAEGELSPAIGTGGAVYVPEPDYDPLFYDANNHFLAAYAKAAPCGGKRVTIAGTAGSETIRGTNKADAIAGLGGRDKISGRGGRDKLCGGKGNDRLNGGPGNDKLLGGAGKDALIGGRGRDKLKGGAGKDKQRQ
jgi:outer membrane protein assembly factor BamB